MNKVDEMKQRQEKSLILIGFVNESTLFPPLSSLLLFHQFILWEWMNWLRREWRERAVRPQAYWEWKINGIKFDGINFDWTMKRGSALSAISLPFDFIESKEKKRLAKLGWLAGSFFWVGYGAGTAQGNKPKEETSSQPSGMKNKFNWWMEWNQLNFFWMEPAKPKPNKLSFFSLLWRR